MTRKRTVISSGARNRFFHSDFSSLRSSK
jgi:hypothetical protein